MIVFFEKRYDHWNPSAKSAEDLQKRRKKQRQIFFQSVGLGPPPPPPPTAKPDENFLDTRMDIRYPGGRETISLLKTFYSAAKI